MTGVAADPGRRLDGLPVIVFTVKGVKMAADVDQVVEMLDAREAEARRLTTAGLDDYISFRGRESSGERRKILLVKDSPTPRAFVVDTADEVATIAVDAIHPMPPLIASARASRALWGLAMRGDEIIVLVDLSDLGRGDDRAASSPAATEV